MDTRLEADLQSAREVFAPAMALAACPNGRAEAVDVGCAEACHPRAIPGPSPRRDPGPRRGPAFRLRKMAAFTALPWWILVSASLTVDERCVFSETAG